MGIMVDPLSLLRQYIASKKDIVEVNNRIYFGEFSWPKQVKTNFLIWRPSDDRNIKEYYTLESILFILKNVHLSHAAYVKQAAAAQIPVVRCEDRQEMLAYLTSEIAPCASIDKSAPLEIPTRSFTGILSLQDIQMRVDMMRTSKPPVESQPAPVPAILPTQRYSRYDQEKFITRKEIEDFKIDTMGSYQGMVLKSVVEGQPQPMLQIGGPGSSRMPIIIIPDAATSLISMFNAKDILEDQKFVPVKQKKAEGAVRENEVFIERKKMLYRVVDDPSKLSTAEWDRVVAVFVLGPAWQFKGWPRAGSPRQILANICAFHLKFDEMKLDVRVTRWAVNVLTLSRTKRELDRTVLGRFWETVDKHMMKKKPHLRF